MIIGRLVRAQYWFRTSEQGLLAWDVRRLIELSANLSTQSIRIADIKELDENHWYAHGDAAPTCRSLIEHFALIQACDLRYPIILSADGRVMDGMHRVCKAVLEGKEEIAAVRFEETPPPDYVGCNPDELPYGE